MAGTSHIDLRRRDREILTTLVRCVRVLTVDQIARHWWAETADPVANADRRMRALAAAHLVRRERWRGHPELQLSRPALTWQPGEPAPALEPLATQLRARWDDASRWHTLVMATPQTVAQFGGASTALPSDDELAHDIHVAAVYLQMRTELPTRAATWTSEVDLPHGPGVKVPDALVGDGLDRTAIEFVGSSYSARKLQTLLAYCDEHDLGLELW